MLKKIQSFNFGQCCTKKGCALQDTGISMKLLKRAKMA